MTGFAKPKPLESKGQKAIIDYATIRGWWCEKVVSKSSRALMDLVAIRAGRTIWIEVKRPREEPTEQQAKRARDMRAHGAEVFSVDSLVAAMEILR